MALNNQFFSLPSSEIDCYFGLEVNAVERELYRKAREMRPEGDLDNLGHVLHKGHQTWIGLEPETLQTPYLELVEICHLLKPQPGEKMIDLGAGYGRLGIVLHHLYPEITFTGFELVPQRVESGNKVFLEKGMSQAKLFTQDLCAEDFILPPAPYYFLYDYGKVAHIRQTLKQLENLAVETKFKVIARGKGSRSIIDYEHPWLSQVFPAHHGPNFSIYTMFL